MNTIKTIFVASLATASLWAQPKTQPAKPPVTTSIENVELVAAGTDHVRFEVHAKVVATRSVTVARIKFEEMRLGEIPFYLTPIDQRMELKSGQAALLPAIAMTIYFRDLDSLEPLEEVVRNGEIRVHGRASADLDLSLIEKLALHKWSGHADIRIDNPIAVSLPGGVAGRTAAMFALNAAQSAIGIAGSTLNGLRNSQQKWNGELKTDFTESMLAAEASYKLLTSEGQTIEMSTRGLGFRVSDGRVLLTGEMAEPWKYDADTMALLQSHKATIVEESRNIAVWPPDANIEKAASLANGRLQIEKIATSAESAIVPVAKRDTSSNYALLRYTGDEDKREAIPLEQSRAEQTWDRVAVFKLNSDGKTETIFVPARRQGDRLIFDTPVDDETFGSPIIVPGGAIGMVQDEHSGMIIPARW
ncbi:MAG TPA: hypothetical protein VHY84_17350 [Bryobacteraceae bacterium]|nr:hypothetical protein [Bryobacteraceae bacterium]